MSEEASNISFAERKERLTLCFNKMLEFLRLAKGTSFTVEESDPRILVKITSEDAGRIIGRHGQTLESLQLVLNRILFKQDENFPVVWLDIDGYSKGERRPVAGSDGEEETSRPPRRERSRRRSERSSRGREESGTQFSVEELEQLARDKAKEVKRWGDPVKLPDLNPRDRRIVHLTLKDDPEVITESEGEGTFKKVVISLRKTEDAPAPAAEAGTAPAAGEEK